MSTFIRPSPPIADCALPHHQPGQRVTWQRWNRGENRMENLHGVVLQHRGDIRMVLLSVDPDGRQLRMTCGPLVEDAQ